MAFSKTTSFALAAGAFPTGAFFVAAAFFGAVFTTFLVGTFFVAFLAAFIDAQRFFCAAAIRLRAAALIPRFLAGAAAFSLP